MSADQEKRAAAEAAAQLVQDGMRVGLGTGSTVAFLLPALAARGLRDLRCVATSVATEQRARELGLPVEPFDALTELDIAIDGADQVAPDRWVVKGGGGAHTREKAVAAAANRFVAIVDSGKLVDALRPPVPIEVLRFGAAATLHRLGGWGRVQVREGWPPSPDDGIICDFHGDLGDPAALAARLSEAVGVVDHGLFPPAMISDVVVGRGDRASTL